MAEPAVQLDEEAPEVAPKVEIKPLLGKQMLRTEHARTVHYATVDCPVDHVTQPEFWRHVADRIRPHDRIEVVHEGGEYFVELFVHDADRHTLKVSEMRRVEFDPVDQSNSLLARLRVEYKGTTKRHCLIIRNDGGVDEIVEEGHQTRKGAELAMVEYSRRFG